LAIHTETVSPIATMYFVLSGDDLSMMNTNELWEALGDVEEDDIPHLLTRLFTICEERLSRKPDDETAQLFFQHRNQALEQVIECNLNRR
jgi:hypothetical protein